MADFSISAGGVFDFSAYGAYIYRIANSDHVWLENMATYTMVFDIMNFNGLVTWSGYLAPGEYQVVGEANSIYGNIFSGTYSGGFSYVTYGFGPAPQNGTPAPLAALPFALGLLRRRRR